MAKGLWEQLDNKSMKPFKPKGPVTSEDILDVFEEMGLTDKLKEIHKDVDCRFKGDRLKKVKRLLDTRDKENITLVEELIKVTKPFKPRERTRRPITVYTGIEGAKAINEALQYETKKQTE
jgi:hypothetical protein